ncbi:HesB/IscA family protein [Oceanospirillum sediminis]|uniref:Iron-sulfur cluster assembly accessory protein n=1 Tax=Oceanospirillum sediminis TaxID=2760088 RepID=A0A839IPA3_9GAMM|nr:iron-sulfur cluster assembly accessory protein [Oceanospirillum sediminis]MBB1486504.1 iron-sulfur cluster assembly accessory protein [Oceanospirillum sediminis]
MLTVTPNAQQAISRFIQNYQGPVAGLRISVSDGGCSGYQYGLQLENQVADDDIRLVFDDVVVLITPDNQALLDGCVVDFVENLEESGFKFENPNAKAACNCGKSFSA